MDGVDEAEEDVEKAAVMTAWWEWRREKAGVEAFKSIATSLRLSSQLFCRSGEVKL